ncbi:uncharacterized protein LOC126285032 [Schistocerca gregaria]|uniref:uncharacterized protein LOC126285032 n=1 Tax=Schistocerca gregaria TaxID=7010 RepID=UPI00211ECFBE|nr:uncharacterized protein LOC126285032 [Schistocerca gregaria]
MGKLQNEDPRWHSIKETLAKPGNDDLKRLYKVEDDVLFFKGHLDSDYWKDAEKTILSAENATARPPDSLCPVFGSRLPAQHRSAPSADARTGGWRLGWAGLLLCGGNRCAWAAGCAVLCCAALCCGRLSPQPPVRAESPASVHLEFRQLPLPFPTSPAMQTLLLLVAASTLSAALGRPTLYHVNDNDKLEPVMVPVSSTVIPLPIYQVSSGVEFGGKDYKNHKPDEPIKLITATKKKTSIKKVEDNTGE